MKKATIFIFQFVVLIQLLLLVGCTGEEIFVANFADNTIGQAPATQQKIGTVQIDGLTGNCVVVNIPNLTGNWVKITRPDNPATVTGIQGKAKQFKGVGKYTFTTTLYIPDGEGVATVQFEPFGQPVTTYNNFLHVDFLKDNRARVNDDDSSIFGTYPRNKPFILQVTLDIKATGSSADIVLSGDGTSGQMHVPTLQNTLAQQFGNIRLWMGFPHVGNFNATNIVLRYENP